MKPGCLQKPTCTSFGSAWGYLYIKSLENSTWKTLVVISLALTCSSSLHAFVDMPLTKGTHVRRRMHVRVSEVLIGLGLLNKPSRTQNKFNAVLHPVEIASDSVAFITSSISSSDGLSRSGSPSSFK